VIHTLLNLTRPLFVLDTETTELDGPNHKTTPTEDAARDSILRTIGWKVIRIKHA